MKAIPTGVLVKGVVEGVCRVDKNFKITSHSSHLDQWFPDKVPIDGKYCYQVLFGCNTPCAECPCIPSTDQSEKQAFQLYLPEGYVWLEHQAYPLYADDTQEISGAIVIIRDITDQVKSTEALRQSNRWFRTLFHESPVSITMHDIATGEIIDANRTAYQSFGLSSVAEFKQNVFWCEPPYSLEDAKAWMRKTFAEGPQQFEWLNKKVDGTLFWEQVTMATIEVGGATHLLATSIDITNLKQTESELRRSEVKYRSLIEQSSNMVCLHDLEGNIVEVNQAVVDTLGYSKEELLQMKIFDLHPQHSGTEEIISEWNKWRVGVPHNFDAHHKKQDGLLIPVSVNAGKVVFDNNHCILALVQDISERKKSEEALRTSQNRYKEIAWHSRTYMWEINIDGLYTYLDDSVKRVTGFSPKEMVMKKTFYDLTPEGEREQVRKAGMDYMQNKIALTGYENCKLTKEGRVIWVSTDSIPVTDENGSVIGSRGLDTEITDRKIVEEHLRKSEEQFRLFAESAPVGIIISDKQRRTVFVSRRFTEMFGYTIDDLPTLKHWWIRAYPDPELQGKVKHEWAESKRTAKKHNEDMRSMETPVTCKDGKVLQVDIRIASTREMNYVIFSDITERHRLEEQLRQAQKMESIGKLAGGIAHDFNNMLMVILGRADLAQSAIADHHPITEDLQEIIKAASHSANLTKQLLAYSRQQVARPVILDVNKKISETCQMIRRLIREDIDIRWIPGKDVFAVRIDPTQFEQVLTNILVNSQDAIIGTGTITITTDVKSVEEIKSEVRRDCAPGDFVTLSIQDDGCGMDRDTLDRVFDPFFTTKHIGEGTGLGLSTVHGIVHQHDGCVHIESEIDKGTKITIYLPAVK